MLPLTQKILVQTSFAKLIPIADQAAQLFYLRLFEIDPSLKAMFRGDMTEQRKKLMQMLIGAVKGLDHPDRLMPIVQELGRRHVAYGVMDAHYDTVGRALLWTLEKGLGPATFTPETREAWIAVYGLLATTMKEAARDACRGEGQEQGARGQEPRANETMATVPSSHAARIRPSAAKVTATTAPCRASNTSIGAPVAASRTSIDPEASPTAANRPVGSVASARMPVTVTDHSALVAAARRYRRSAGETARSVAAIRRPSRNRPRSAAKADAVW
jgi:hemoglobin-like flavoprotein